MNDQSYNSEDLDDQQDNSVPSTQQIYYNMKRRQRQYSKYIQLLCLLGVMLVTIAYSANSDQNVSVDINQVELPVVIKEDLKSFLKENTQGFVFSFKDVFIAYQTIQFANNQSSKIRYFLSLFDEFVFGQINDGHVINVKEQQVLDQCVKNHEEEKEIINITIKRLQEELKELNKKKGKLLRFQLEAMKSYLELKEHQMRFVGNGVIFQLQYIEYSRNKVNGLIAWISQDKGKEIVNDEIRIEGEEEDMQENQNFYLCEERQFFNNTQDICREQEAIDTEDETIDNQLESDELMKNQTDSSEIGNVVTKGDLDKMIFWDKSSGQFQWREEDKEEELGIKAELLENDDENIIFEIIENEMELISRIVQEIEKSVMDFEDKLLRQRLRILFELNVGKQNRGDEGEEIEEYIVKNAEFREGVFLKRWRLEGIKREVRQQSKDIEEEYNRQVKDRINQFVDSYFSCIRDGL